MNKKKAAILLTSMALIGGSFMFFNSKNVSAEQDVKHEQNLVDLNQVPVQSSDFSADTGWTFKNSDRVELDGKHYGHLKTDVHDASITQRINVETQTDYTVTFTAKSANYSGFGNFDIRGVVNGETPIMMNGTDIPIDGSDFKTYTVKFNSGEFTSVQLEFVKYTETESEFAAVENTEIWATDISVSGSEEYQYVWADDFNGSQLDTDKWDYELGHVRGIEQQHYVKSSDNVYVNDGKLTLKATDRPLDAQYQIDTGEKKLDVIYNSGSIRTHDSQEFLYGRIEMKAKLPKGQGVFPAFWTLGSDFTLDGMIAKDQGYGWARCGEIDIMELTGVANGNGNKTVYQTIHTSDKPDNSTDHKLAGTAHSIGSDFNDDYHIFGINWSKDKVEWYVDNQIVHTESYAGDAIAQRGLNKPHYVQLNLAMGGSWPGEVATGLAGTTYDIDYVYYAQTEQQKADSQEYYQTAPTITGAQNITMEKGEVPDLLSGVKASAGYQVNYSVDDESFFENNNGRSSVHLTVDGVKNKEKLSSLAPGKYTLYYTAIPENVKMDDNDSTMINCLEDYKFTRKTVTLTVLEVSKDILKQKIEQGTKLVDQTSVYTSYTIDYLTKSLDWAQYVHDDEDATQEYVDAAVDLLNDSIAKLRKR